MTSLEVLGSITTALLLLGLALSVGSHRSRSVAVRGIVLGSLTLLSMLGVAIYMAVSRAVARVPFIYMSLGCDAVSLIVLVNVVALGIACLVASYSYCAIVEEHAYGPYYALMILFLASMALIPLCRSWLWFLFMFEVMTFASYFLIGFEYTKSDARRIAWNYFVTMHILCTIPLVIAVGLVYGYTHTFNFVKASIPDVALALFLLGFATKSGLFPLHFWLPEAHPVAPTPVSALLSGAMVEMGVYGMLRAVQLYGPPPLWLSILVLSMALISTVAAVMSYHRQRDVKKIFAWSTIDNMGWMYLYLAMGIGGVPLATYVLNHGLAKAAAFLSSGLLLYVFGSRDLEVLRGSFSVNRLSVGLMILSIFALEGVPPFNFFWSKFDVVRRALVINTPIGVVYALLWVIAFVQFLHMVHRLVSTKSGEHENHDCKTLRSPPHTLVASIVTLLALLLVSNYLCQFIASAIGWGE